MGIDYVGFGIDSMYGDHRKAVGRRLPRGHYNRPSRIKEAPWKSPLAAPRFSGWDDPAIDPGYAKGLENPSDNLNQIRWLVGHGYTDEDIIKIMGGNALQLLRAVWY
jgi:membrane dipeptidase